MAGIDREPVTIASILGKMRAHRNTPAQDEGAMLIGRQAFLDALQLYPIDNRREGESFRDSFTRGETGKSHPPRNEFAKFRLGSKEAVVDYTLDMLRADYPRHMADYGETKARLEILARLDLMEKARKNGWGLEGKGGAAKSENWNFGDSP